MVPLLSLFLVGPLCKLTELFTGLAYHLEEHVFDFDLLDLYRHRAVVARTDFLQQRGSPLRGWIATPSMNWPRRLSALVAYRVRLHCCVEQSIEAMNIDAGASDIAAVTLASEVQKLFYQAAMPSLLLSKMEALWLVASVRSGMYGASAWHVIISSVQRW